MTTRYTKDHEYIRIEGDTGIVGITDYAQSQLGDVVYVELPAVGKSVAKGGEAAVVESVKAASEVYAPVSGEVTAVNSALEGAPGTVIATPDGREVGTVTSGGFGPSVNGPVAMGYVAREFATPGTKLHLVVRGKPLPAQVVPMPFAPHRYKRG